HPFQPLAAWIPICLGIFHSFINSSLYFWLLKRYMPLPLEYIISNSLKKSRKLQLYFGIVKTILKIFVLVFKNKWYNKYILIFVI
ncbi:MAG: hypothetical protein RR315_07870, partial [Oscillospiraceae bacterium]